MSDQPYESRDAWSLSLLKHVDEICDRYENAWNDEKPRIEDYLCGIPESERWIILRELLLLDVALHRQSNDRPKLNEYQQRFPEYAELVEVVLRKRLV